MEPYMTAKMFGLVFWGIVLVWGIVKCTRIAKRETTCSKCVYGLMITLIGMLTAFLFGSLKTAQFDSLGLFLLLGITWLILLISGSVLAIIGLSEYNQHPEYTQGRGQAVTAIVFSVVFIGLVVFGLYQSITRQSSMGYPFSKTGLPPGPGASREFKTLNFKYKLPPSPWVELDVKKVNPDAIFAMINGRLKILFMIIAEKGGLDLEVNSASLAEISRGNLKSIAPNVKFSEEKPYTVNGLPGLHFSGNAHLNRRDFTYVYWTCSHNGYLYQLITFGTTPNKQQLHQEAKKLFNNFEQLDKNKVIYSNPALTFGTFTSKTFNYTVDLKDTRWKKWESLSSDMPNAETGGYMPDGSWFCVIPFYYGKESLSLDILAHVLIQSVELEFPGKHIKNLTHIKEAGMRGYRFITHKNLDGTDYVYHNKVLKGKECGYLVMFGTPQNNLQEKTLAGEVFAGVRFNDKQPSALDLSALPRQQKINHALRYNDLGLFYYKAKQYHNSLRYFKTAFALKPEDQVIFENHLLALLHVEKYKEGLAAIESLETLPQENKEIRAWKATFLARLDRKPEAIAVFRQLFAENHRDDEDFSIYIDLLTQQQQWDEAEAAFKTYLGDNDSLKLRLDQAYLYHQQGKYRDSIKILTEQQRQVPFNAEIAYALIRDYRALGEYKEGLEVCKKLIDNGFDSKDAYYEKGSLEYHLKWYPQAKKSFEKALSYSPDDKDVREDLKYVSGLLGEGDNTMLKDAIAAVPLPEMVKSKLPPLTVPPPEKGCSAYFISDVEGIHFQAEKGTTITRYRTIKVTDSGAVSRFSTLEFDFNPLLEKIFVNRLIVRDPEGKVVSRGKPSDYYLVDKQKSAMATHDQTLNIPVPNLLPGYIIQLTCTLERLADKHEFSFYTSSLSTSFPTVFSARFVTGDVQRLVHQGANGVREQSLEEGKLWYMNNPPVYRWEPNQVFYSHFLPMVWLNDGSFTWQSLGRQYLEDIREKMAKEPRVTALAKELTTGMSSNQEKINALTRYLQKTYTYKALEFGRRARIPNKASQIIANKYGDCKDHALLLHQLLEALDIPAYLALVNQGHPIKPQLPSLDQFDHMILYIPGDPDKGANRGKFIDTTDKGLDLRLHVPTNLGGKQALVLNPDNIRLIKIPDYEPGTSKVTIQKDIRLVKPKEMNIRETVEIIGYSASFMREYLKWYETSKQSQWAHGLLSRYLDSLELKSVQIKHLYDNWQPLLLEFDYTVSDQSRLPNVWEAYYLEIDSVKERKTPFRVYYPFILDSRCTVKAPVGFALEVKGGHKSQKQQDTFARWESQVRFTPSQLGLHLQCTIIPGEYEARQYSYYYKLMSKAAKSMSVELSCQKR